MLERLERLDMVALLCELALVLAGRANAGEVIGRPLRQGRLSSIFSWGVLGMGIIAPLTLQARSMLSGKPSRRAVVPASILALVGGFCLRYVMVMAGRASADDPQATFAFARRAGRPE